MITMKEEHVNQINVGEFTPDVLRDIVLEFTEKVKRKIFQRFYRDKASTGQKKFTEYLLIETTRTLLGDSPVSFYYRTKYDKELRQTLGLKHLKTVESYNDFDRKRKYSKTKLNNLIKKNLDIEGENIYALDSVVIEVDINEFKNSEIIKNGEVDAEFIHSTTKGTVTGFEVYYLINLSNTSFEKVAVYSKKSKKKDIWDEMVVQELGTKQGEIKTVIADAGLFAYDNYLESMRNRLVPVINPRSDLEERTVEKIQNCDSNLVWFGDKYQHQLSELLEEFQEIIELTSEGVQNYDDFMGFRSKIELVFKMAKRVFGMDDMHVYYRGNCYWKSFLLLYLSSLLCQYLEMNDVNLNRAIPLLEQNRYPL